MRTSSTSGSVASLEELVLPAWRTNCRITRLLISSIPPKLWPEPIPGMPRRTVRMVAAHLHNSRSSWIKTLGVPLGIERPPMVKLNTVTRRALLSAMRGSDEAMEQLLRVGVREGGHVPATPGYVWRNLPLDVGHVLTYFIAHEAHHRGQLLLAARQLGAPLPREVMDRLWWWQPPRATART